MSIPPRITLLFAACAVILATLLAGAPEARAQMTEPSVPSICTRSAVSLEPFASTSSTATSISVTFKDPMPSAYDATADHSFSVCYPKTDGSGYARQQQPSARDAPKPVAGTTYTISTNVLGLDGSVLHTLTADTDYWILFGTQYGNGSIHQYVRTASASSDPAITIAAGTSPVTEGTNAQFTVTASSAPTSALTVNLTVSESAGSDYVASGDEGSKTVEIGSGSTTATYNVTTQADTTDEPNGTVTVTVTSGTGYTVGTTSSANVTVNDDDTNNAATGAPTISGFAQVQQTLTAATSGIMDTDGLTSVTYSYQWIRVDGGTDSDISGATSSTYTLAAADQGKTVKVKVTFQDDDGNSEELTSTATAAVVAAARSCTTGNAWCATLTVAQESGAKAKGYCNGVSICSTAYGTLSDTTFTLDSTDYTVKSIRWGDAGSESQGNKLHLTLDQDFPAADLPSLTLKVTSHELALSDATRGNNKNNVSNNYQWSRPSIANDAVGLRMTVELLQAATDTTAPTVSGAPAVTSNPGSDSTYAIGDTISVKVTFDENVTVTGTPQLELAVGANNRQANYASGSGSTELVFSYTVVASDADTDGIAVAADKLTLNGGTIKDAADNNATLTHSALAAQSTHKVDGRGADGFERDGEGHCAHDHVQRDAGRGVESGELGLYGEEDAAERLGDHGDPELDGAVDQHRHGHADARGRGGGHRQRCESDLHQADNRHEQQGGGRRRQRGGQLHQPGGHHQRSGIAEHVSGRRTQLSFLR